MCKITEPKDIELNFGWNNKQKNRNETYLKQRLAEKTYDVGSPWEKRRK